MIKIGIPRALLYYQYYPMWKAFFQELGAEVVVSPSTTQSMLEAGSSRVVADTCLPVKVFLGHVLYLAEQCDYMFIPSVRSVSPKAYNCSKFLGLPDMTRAVIPESPSILEIDIDINQGKRKLYQSIYQLGRHFSWNPLKVKQATIAAWRSHLSYRELMFTQGLTPPKAIAQLCGSPQDEPQATTSYQSQTGSTIALIGHPYIIHDDHINHRLIPRLKQAHCQVLTPEGLTSEELELATARLVGRAYWTYEEEVVGAGGHYLENNVDGVIGVMTFGCGPDSLMMEMVRRQAVKLRATPFMSLTIEEHTAVAGIVTRLEAFLDMIHRRKREVKACA